MKAYTDHKDRKGKNLLFFSSDTKTLIWETACQNKKASGG